MFSLFSFSLTLLIFLVILMISVFSSALSYKILGTLILEWEIFGISNMNFPLVVILDKYSVFMGLTVLIISTSVFIFSSSYMKPSSSYSLKLFYCVLLLFVSSMLLLILSPGAVSLFLGWDGLGITSYLLILTYSNSKCMGSAILTVMSNRLGDAMLLASMGILLLSLVTNPMSISLNCQIPLSLLILFIAGASTKSAQIPFSAWLPAAMAAPTPVSSLVHSSTLVTAGVYVMIRFKIFLGPLNWLLLLMGGLTTLMASLSALSELDIKKIIALSTLSQLGIMVMALGANSPTMSFFHLMVHAFFKALMFVCIGDLIHATYSVQDLKMFGVLSSPRPITSALLVSAKLALCGLPFFSGFFSKETILENLSFSATTNFIIYIILFVSIGLTIMYSARFILKVLLKFGATSSLSSESPDKVAWTASALLLIPGVTGGASLHSIFLEETCTHFSPSFSKELTLLMLLIFFMMGMKISLNPLSSSPSSKILFNLWFSPESSFLYSFSKKMPELLMSKLTEGAWGMIMSGWLFKLSQHSPRSLSASSKKPLVWMSASLSLLIMLML